VKLIKLANSELCQAKEVPGLLSCQIVYEIKSGKGRIDYTGPKFPHLMWHEVMSFFRWTNKEMDSESQVRLYVNTKLGRWGAWAFPQEARTGMNAREIATPETKEQAVERFGSWNSAPSGDWLYFCSVHHHCSTSAFQSGTDEENERNQDGLHITVGQMDSERHDIHARFYLAGNCFEPDLSLFWQIDPQLAEQVPQTMLDALARFQMCEKVVVDFPDAWRKNVIEKKMELRKSERRGDLDLWEARQLEMPVWLRVEHALREISRNFSGEEDLLGALQSLDGDPILNFVVQACLQHQVTPEEMLREIQQYEPGF
jgi:hypothetical protein